MLLSPDSMPPIQFRDYICAMLRKCNLNSSPSEVPRKRIKLVHSKKFPVIHEMSTLLIGNYLWINAMCFTKETYWNAMGVILPGLSTKD